MKPLLFFALLLCAAAACAQEPQSSSPDQVHIQPRVDKPLKTRDSKTSAREEPATTETAAPLDEEEDSSSKQTRIDLSPPNGEAQKYPDSDISSDVQEVHPWNPHNAQKDVEVGDFYFKRNNYKGALARYEDALHWQDNDAEAMWKAAITAEKMGDKESAASYYSAYLKTLPHGEHADDAQRSLAKLTH